MPTSSTERTGAMTEVLLAEDDAAIAEPLARALTREGYGCVVVGDGRPRLSRASGSGPSRSPGTPIARAPAAESRFNTPL